MLAGAIGGSNRSKRRISQISKIRMHGALYFIHFRTEVLGQYAGKQIQHEKVLLRVYQSAT